LTITPLFIGQRTPMQRYYFHIEDGGDTIVDREGIELADLDAAREEAVAAARQIMSNDVLRGRTADGRRFVITVDGGTIVAEIPFRATIAASSQLEPRSG